MTDILVQRGREIEVGTAGEHLVCADIIMGGYRAFLAAQGLPYDVVADVDGLLLRVAVKSAQRATRRPAREGDRVCYQFSVTRSRRRSSGKTDARPYSQIDADIVALVALDIRQVAFVPMSLCKASMHLDHPRDEETPTNRRSLVHVRKRFSHYSLATCLAMVIQ